MLAIRCRQVDRELAMVVIHLLCDLLGPKLPLQVQETKFASVASECRDEECYQWRSKQVPEEARVLDAILALDKLLLIGAWL